MSDNWLIAIPSDPAFIPEPERQSRAHDWFNTNYPEADEIEIEVTESIQFISCGGNFERICCPACQAEVETAWWQVQMDNDYDDNRGFSFTRFEMPCCGATSSLPELVYEWPQGFARFSVSALNPGRPSNSETPVWPVSDDKNRELSEILGTPIRWIALHF